MVDQKRTLLITTIAFLVFLLITGGIVTALLLTKNSTSSQQATQNQSKKAHPLIGKWKPKENELSKIPKGTEIGVEFTETQYIISAKETSSLSPDNVIRYDISIGYKIESESNNVYKLSISGVTAEVLNTNMSDTTKKNAEKKLTDMVSSSLDLRATFDIILNPNENEFREKKPGGSYGIYYVRYE